jgi:hypothetical protein
VKAGWLAVFDVFPARCAFRLFSRLQQPTNQPTNLHGQIDCTGMGLKVGRHRQPTNTSQPLGFDGWRNGWTVADVAPTNIGTRYRIVSGGDYRVVGADQIRLCQEVA